MSTVDGITTKNGVNTINPAEMSKQDFITAVYLERGEMLDTEVRRLVSEIDRSNAYVDTLTKLVSKANQAEFDKAEYSKPTWQVSGKTITLDGGYTLQIQPDKSGGNAFVLNDSRGNQLVYQNQTLIPIKKDTAANALEVGIPVMNDMTFMLANGIEISFKADAPDEAFDNTKFSGGLANISSIIITKDNQGMEIKNFGSVDDVEIVAPTVEIPEDSRLKPKEKTELIPIAEHKLTFAKQYGDSDGGFEDIPGRQRTENIAAWNNIFNKKSPSERKLIMDKIIAQGGLTIAWEVKDSDGEDNVYRKSYTVEPYFGEDLTAYIERLITDSSKSLDYYLRDAETGDIDIYLAKASITIPAYNLPVTVPTSKATTKEQAAYTTSLYKYYHQTSNYGVMSEFLNDRFYKKAISDYQKLKLNEWQKKGLIQELIKTGVSIRTQLTDTDGGVGSLGKDYYDQTYKYKMVYGETVEEFFKRVAQQSHEYFQPHIRVDEDEGNINIQSMTATMNIPKYSYKEYEKIDPDKPYVPLKHKLDTGNKDGHILFESNGMHDWEYAGRNISAYTVTNPNDPDKVVDGYFARKLAFKDASDTEFSGTAPLLTVKERELLLNELKLSYSDASKIGQLTRAEWKSLKTSLINARDNLNGSSQLQTVQLQRAMLTYNQNFDAMSNMQQRIFSLLRDISGSFR